MILWGHDEKRTSLKLVRFCSNSRANLSSTEFVKN